MVVLAEPNPDSLLSALEQAVQHVHTVDPMRQHEQVTVTAIQLTEFGFVNCRHDIVMHMLSYHSYAA